MPQLRTQQSKTSALGTVQLQIVTSVITIIIIQVAVTHACTKGVESCTLLLPKKMNIYVLQSYSVGSLVYRHLMTDVAKSNTKLR